VFIKCWVFVSPKAVQYHPGIYKTPFLKLVLLDQTMGGSHLWTIPIEINYYFIIPVICLIMFACSKRVYFAFTVGTGLFFSWNFFKAQYNQK